MSKDVSSAIIKNLDLLPHYIRFSAGTALREIIDVLSVIWVFLSVQEQLRKDNMHILYGIEVCCINFIPASNGYVELYTT